MLSIIICLKCGHAIAFQLHFLNAQINTGKISGCWSAFKKNSMYNFKIQSLQNLEIARWTKTPLFKLSRSVFTNQFKTRYYHSTITHAKAKGRTFRLISPHTHRKGHNWQ